MAPRIHIKTVISKSSNLLERDVQPFEQKVQEALSHALTHISHDLYCNIAIDGNIPESFKSQFVKVKDNTYIGFTDNVIEDSTRRALLFDLMAITDDKIRTALNVVVLISCNPINQPDRSANSESKTSSEYEDKLPSYEAVLPKYDLDKVILDNLTHNQILRAIALINNQTLIFDTWGFRDVDPNTKTILCFYGAPGTGKTMCAHAIAKKIGKNILIASYASIESKWVGEGPKNMRKIFEDASNQDAILFFDEADSFLSKRVNNAETGSDKHYNRMSNEMFQLLEDFDGVVIFATNLVTDFDKAFKSRILSFVEFTLPDSNTRKKLIQSMIPSKLPLVTPLTEYEYEILSSASDGFSGREIRKALLTSLSEAALNSRTTLSIDDLLIGFVSVQSERKAIEDTATRERNIISDYLVVSEQNAAIIDFCHWAFDQQDMASDSSKESLYKICKVLNSEMPDLSISYKGKNLENTAKIIEDADRSEETLIYVAQILSNANISASDASDIIEIAAAKLHSLKASDVTTYYNLTKKILSI